MRKPFLPLLLTCSILGLLSPGALAQRTSGRGAGGGGAPSHSGGGGSRGSFGGGGGYQGGYSRGSSAPQAPSRPAIVPSRPSTGPSGGSTGLPTASSGGVARPGSPPSTSPTRSAPASDGIPTRYASPYSSGSRYFEPPSSTAGARRGTQPQGDPDYDSARFGTARTSPTDAPADSSPGAAGDDGQAAGRPSSRRLLFPMPYRPAGDVRTPAAGREALPGSDALPGDRGSIPHLIDRYRSARPSSSAGLPTEERGRRAVDLPSTEPSASGR